MTGRSNGLAVLGAGLLALASCRSAPQTREPESLDVPRVTATAVPTAPPTRPPPAAAVPGQPTPRTAPDPDVLEILELARSGASQETLLAKVRSEDRRYDLTTAEVLELRGAGVPEAVVEAMLRSGRR